jgi:hypothetical protein
MRTENLRERSRTFALVFLLVLAVVGPLVHRYTDQPASRYVLTAALWDNQTVKLDGLEHAIGQDAAVRDGHVYSDKAPLQPFLGVAFYAPYRLVGGEPASMVRERGNLGLWWQTLWSAAVPLAALAVLLLWWLRRLGGKATLPATLSIVFGTILLPFGGLLFGHSMTALFVTASLVLVLESKSHPTRLLGAGALAGAAVATEYQALMAVLAVTAYVLWVLPRKALWFVAGGLPFAALLGVYHSVAFGSPFSHPYTYNVFWGTPTKQRGVLEGFTGFQPDNLVRLLFSGRGFLIASPIVLLGVFGLILTIRSGDRSKRSAAILVLAVFVAMMMVPLFWANPWGGHSPGPRYLAVGIPALVLGVAAAWSVRPLLTRAAIGLSVVTMALATFTNPLVDDEGPGGIGTWLGLAREGDFVDTVFTMALGNWGWLLHAALVTLVGWLLFRSWSRESYQDRMQLRSAAI